MAKVDNVEIPNVNARTVNKHLAQNVREMGMETERPLRRRLHMWRWTMVTID
ncbi:hypothetical protein [Sphingobium sp. Sx8-8]|uniref:hypothetical protein n=1 Tax=Sphingobium sp. Sx8-8 TaxID=2933617 RepID=UPI001F5AB8C5|nr:hypothetical protein [Sphingobium sp. Sx8-8]